MRVIRKEAKYLEKKAKLIRSLPYWRRRDLIKDILSTFGISFQEIVDRGIHTDIISCKAILNGKELPIRPGIWSSSFKGDLYVVRYNEEKPMKLKGKVVYVDLKKNDITSPKRYLIALRAYESGAKGVLFGIEDNIHDIAYPLSSGEFPIPILHTPNEVKEGVKLHIETELFNRYREVGAYRIFIGNRRPCVRIISYYDRDNEVDIALILLRALIAIEELLEWGVEVVLLECSHFGDQSILSQGLLDYKIAKTSEKSITVHIRPSNETLVLAPFKELEYVVRYFDRQYYVAYSHPMISTIEWILEGSPLLELKIKKESIGKALQILLVLSNTLRVSLSPDTKHLSNKIREVEVYAPDDLKELIRELSNAIRGEIQLTWESAMVLNRWHLCGASGQIASYLAELDKVKDLYYVRKFIKGESSINEILKAVKDFQWCSLSRTYAREAFAQRRRPLWFSSTLKMCHIMQDKRALMDSFREDYELMKSYVRARLEYLLDILRGGAVR